MYLWRSASTQSPLPGTDAQYLVLYLLCNFMILNYIKHNVYVNYSLQSANEQYKCKQNIQ